MRVKAEKRVNGFLESTGELEGIKGWLPGR
jgi:hypothetical protein